MKTIIAAVLCLVVFFPLAASAGTDKTDCPGASVVDEKTRAEVRAELLQAEHDGWITATKQRAYPPDSERGGLNRSVYDASVGTRPYYQASNRQP
ncbi:DUF4148 domain-containing protein [Paraburkholderia sp. D15]|uniref:DUF4148 domain-containing protein n=1 Tax=Paraburkholderia sp. D15 TaxID=2880218 RepID=UPI0024788C64|nr:DUF4148 domain-containing protein [Paraburkholderia sp. D15]WGS52848.1 DUF4148 domain-containing protein [Paraburkholderia sp. D15]